MKIEVKADAEFRGVLPPHTLVTLEAGTEVEYHSQETPAGVIHVATWYDWGTAYQSYRLAPHKSPDVAAVMESAPDAFRKTIEAAAEANRKEALNAIYQDAVDAQPTPAPAPDEPRRLVLYTSKSGTTARYRVIREFVGRDGRPRVALRPADWVGDIFSVRASLARPIAPHATEPAANGNGAAAPPSQQQAEEGNPFDDAPEGDTPAAPAGRAHYEVTASDLGLSPPQGWPETLEYDPDGWGVQSFRFAGLDVDADTGVTGARYRSDEADLKVIDD